MDSQTTPPKERKRSSPGYWVERNGKLYARLQYKTDSGTYKVKYRPIDDKRTARTVVEDMRRELLNKSDEAITAEKMTFADLAAKYEKVELVEAVYQHRIKIKGRRSINSAKSAIKPLLDFFGTRQISTIKPSDVKAYKNERIATPVQREVNVRIQTINPKTGRKKFLVTKELRSSQRKMSTINRELSVLRAILNFAIDNEWMTSNPFQRMRGIISRAAEVERDRVLSFDEEERLLSACVDERAHVRPLLICALDTGMRRGEMFKMIWNDVSFETGEITIPQTNTKTEETRLVAMTPRLRSELERLWAMSPQDLSWRVFGITNSIKKSWATACRNAGISDFRLHDCRHTATTRMIASGSPHTEVMKITGHSQLKTFLRYLTITTNTANKVANRLSDYITEAKTPTEVTEVEYLQ